MTCFTVYCYKKPVMNEIDKRKEWRVLLKSYLQNEEWIIVVCRKN